MDILSKEESYYVSLISKYKFLNRGQPSKEIICCFKRKFFPINPFLPGNL